MSGEALYAAVRYLDERTLKFHTVPVEKIKDFDLNNYSSQPFHVLRYCPALEEDEYVPGQVVAVDDDPEKLVNPKKRFHVPKMRLSDAAAVLAEKEILNSVNCEKNTAAEDSDERKDDENVNSKQTSNEQTEFTKVRKSKQPRKRFKESYKNVKKDNAEKEKLQDIINTKMKSMAKIDLTFDGEPSSEISELKQKVEDLEEKNCALQITTKWKIEENIALNNQLKLKEERITLLENKVKEMKGAEKYCPLPASSGFDFNDCAENPVDNDFSPLKTSEFVTSDCDSENDTKHISIKKRLFNKASKKENSDESDFSSEKNTEDKKIKSKSHKTIQHKTHDGSESYDTEDYEKETEENIERFGKYKSWTDPSKNELKMCHLHYGVSIPYKSWVTIREAKTSSIFIRKLASVLWSKKKLSNKAFKIDKVINEKSKREPLTPKKKAILKKCYLHYCAMRGLLPNSLTKKKRQCVINQWRRHLSVFISYLRQTDLDDDDEAEFYDDNISRNFKN